MAVSRFRNTRALNTLDSNHKPLFPRGPGVGLRALLWLGISVGLLVFDFRGEQLQPLRRTLAVGVTPLVWTASLPMAVSDLIEHFRFRERLINENRSLREKQLVLDAQLQKFQALEADNLRIRALLSSSEHLKDHVLIAEIIEINQDPYRHQITLNKGEHDGVYRGQPLVDAQGILGQVVQVNTHSSVALLITDPDHGLPVEINRTGLQTIALGIGDGQALKLPFLPGNVDIVVGDLLVSSGLGGRFPPGYPVALVQEVRNIPGEHFKEAIAYPTARINQGRQALLVFSEHLKADGAVQADAAAAPADAAAAP